MPHLAIDPIVAAAQIVTGLQTIASRNVHPLEGAVVSVTQIHGGDTWNVVPDSITIRGTTRSFSAAVQDTIESSIRRIGEGICGAHGATLAMRYERRYPPTPGGLGVAVAWGLPYFRRHVPKQAALQLPVDLRASRTRSARVHALSDAIRFPFVAVRLSLRQPDRCHLLLQRAQGRVAVAQAG